MPELLQYRLHFHGGLHIGTQGVNLEEAGLTIPSDTLFAALVDAVQRAGGQAEEFARPFLQAPVDPPFLLTSAFPFVGEVLFYPTPVDLEGLFLPDTLRTRAKDLKRIRYLSFELLQKALTGRKLDADLFPIDESSEPDRGAALQGGALWFSLEEISKFPEDFRRRKGRLHALPRLAVWRKGKVPRVTVGRVTSSSTLYHIGRVVFAAECGLWFGVVWRKPDQPLPGTSLTYRQAFEQALEILQSDGLGGERSSGYGTFRAEHGPAIQLQFEPQIGKPVYLLSRYHPAPEELPAALDGDPCSYNLVAVAGWLNSPEGPAQRRKKIHMISEGSLVIAQKPLMGDVPDVRPTYQNPAGDLPHPVYRYGLAFALAWPEEPERS